MSWLSTSFATIFVHCNDNWSQRDVDKNKNHNEVQVSQKGFRTYSILQREKKKRGGKTKSQECSYLHTILVFYHEPNRTYLSLTVQLDCTCVVPLSSQQLIVIGRKSYEKFLQVYGILGIRVWVTLVSHDQISAGKFTTSTKLTLDLRKWSLITVY